MSTSKIAYIGIYPSVRSEGILFQRDVPQEVPTEHAERLIGARTDTALAVFKLVEEKKEAPVDATRRTKQAPKD